MKFALQLMLPLQAGAQGRLRLLQSRDVHAQRHDLAVRSLVLHREGPAPVGTRNLDLRALARAYLLQPLAQPLPLSRGVRRDEAGLDHLADELLVRNADPERGPQRSEHSAHLAIDVGNVPFRIAENDPER